MVDTQPAVAAKAGVAVVPPRITLLGLRKQAVAVGQAQRHQRTQLVTLFLRAVDRVLQAHRIPHVGVVKGDVVVTHQHQLGVHQQLGLDPVAQGLEPVHLVLKLLGARSLAVGEIRANHPHAVHRAGDHPRQLVAEAGDVFHHVDGFGCAEQGHAVVGLLAKPLRLVTGCRKGRMRKLVVGHLGLLQHQHINRVGCQPVQHLWQADRQGVHVPGGESHQTKSSL